MMHVMVWMMIIGGFTVLISPLVMAILGTLCQTDLCDFHIKKIMKNIFISIPTGMTILSLLLFFICISTGNIKHIFIFKLGLFLVNGGNWILLFSYFIFEGDVPTVTKMGGGM